MDLRGGVAKAIPLFVYGVRLAKHEGQALGPGIRAEGRVIIPNENVNRAESLVRPDTSPVERFIAPLH